MDLPDSSTVQSCHQPSDAGSLWREILRPDQGGTCWDQAERKKILRTPIGSNYLFFRRKTSCMLVLPVIFELGHHDAWSFNANVDFLQAEGERVCELHRRHHLFIHPTPTWHLQNDTKTHQNDQCNRLSTKNPRCFSTFIG